MFESYDEILDLEEVAKILKIGNTHTYRILRSGELRGYKEGKNWKIPRVALEEYVKEKMDSRNAAKTNIVKENSNKTAKGVYYDKKLD